MKRALITLGAVACVLALSAPAWAGPNSNAVVSLHAKTHTTKATTYCTTQSPLTNAIPCSNFNMQWDLADPKIDIYLVIAGGAAVQGIAGVSCGIEYNPSSGQGLDMFAWTLCADLEFTNVGPNGEWPESGGGNRITWADNCQTTVLGSDGAHAVAGCFYVYAYGPDTFKVTANKNLESGPELAVASCAAETDQLPFGRGAFVTVSAGGTQQGCNPCTEADRDCEGVPVQPSTWGDIKSKF
jgi:hypothetical protein